MTAISKEIRPYQSDAIQAVLSDWNSGIQSSVLSLPTGVGKTFTSLSLLKEFCTDGKGFIFVVHRDFLVKQTAKEARQLGLEVYAKSGNYKDGDPTSPNVVTTIQYLARSKNLDAILDGRDLSVLVYDECHHAFASMYRKVQAAFVEKFPSGKVLGLTATLVRSDGKPLGEVFQKLSYFQPVQKFIRDKYLAPIKAFRVVCPDLDMSGVKITRDGDFDEQGTVAAVNSSQWKSILLSKWKEEARGKRTIVFAPSVGASEEFAEFAVKNGVSCEHVDANTAPEKRAVILEEFATGKLTMLSNFNILTEGFDVPGIECVIMARPTKSQSVYIQCVGRGLRLFPGKEFATVLDLTDKDHTIVQFGEIEPQQYIKNLKDDIEIDDSYGDELISNILVASERRRGPQQFETGTDSMKQAVDLLNRGVVWQVFGHRATVELGDRTLLLVPEFEFMRYFKHHESPDQKITDSTIYIVADIVRDASRRMPEADQVTALYSGNCVDALDYAISFASAKAKKWAKPNSKWRLDKELTPDQITRLESFQIKREVTQKLTKGTASNLLSYLFICRKYRIPLHDAMEVAKKQLPIAPAGCKSWTDRALFLEGAMQSGNLIITNDFERKFIADVAHKVRNGWTKNWSARQDVTLEKIFNKHTKGGR